MSPSPQGDRAARVLTYLEKAVDAKSAGDADEDAPAGEELGWGEGFVSLNGVGGPSPIETMTVLTWLCPSACFFSRG